MKITFPTWIVQWSLSNFIISNWSFTLYTAIPDMIVTIYCLLPPELRSVFWLQRHFTMVYETNSTYIGVLFIGFKFLYIIQHILFHPFLMQKYGFYGPVWLLRVTTHYKPSYSTNVMLERYPFIYCSVRNKFQL